MSVSSEDIKMLSAEFDRADIHWRAQSITKDGNKAMALAFIDARDVMERLDSICGVENWQCRYSHAEKKVVCDIGIKINDEWIWKADGAGDTQVEAEKGSLSDAFKRAAVRWGIGRYLYGLDAPWVPCEVNDRKQWKRWTADPWSFVKGASQSKPKPKEQSAASKKDLWENKIKPEIAKAFLDAGSTADATKIKLDIWADLKKAGMADDSWKSVFQNEYETNFNAWQNARTVGA